MGEFSLFHWLIVIAILLLFFGPSKLPQLGQSLGKAIRGFKSAMNEVDAEAKDITQSAQLNQNGQGGAQQAQGQASAEKNKNTQS